MVAISHGPPPLRGSTCLAVRHGGEVLGVGAEGTRRRRRRMRRTQDGSLVVVVNHLHRQGGCRVELFSRRLFL